MNKEKIPLNIQFILLQIDIIISYYFTCSKAAMKQIDILSLGKYLKYNSKIKNI